jgi:hypothetical protein
MLITPALRRLKQEDCKFKNSLGYIANSTPAWATSWYPVSKKQNNNKQTKNLLGVGGSHL